MLSAADNIVPENPQIKFCESDIQVQFAAYAVEVFQAPMDFETEINVG